MIRFANENDINKIMEFIDTYWKKGHILAKNESFFRYEHLLDEGVTYVVSEKDTGELEAILGYIPYGKNNRDIMTVMWKANHTDNPTLGIDLLNFLKENANVRILASPGSNKKLSGLYKYLGYSFGKMKHWYRLANKESYKIAKIEDAFIPKNEYKPIEYRKLNYWDDLNVFFDFQNYYSNNPKPLKEDWYIKRRYFEHPIYNYDVYGVTGSYGERSIIILREVAYADSKALRLIDVIGKSEILAEIGSMMDDLLEQYDAEYIDCYETGVPDEMLFGGGWLRVDNSGNIIPNYFSPFVQENIDIYYFSTDPNIVLFKGDGDQDRPN